MFVYTACQNSFPVNQINTHSSSLLYCTVRNPQSFQDSRLEFAIYYCPRTRCYQYSTILCVLPYIKVAMIDEWKIYFSCFQMLIVRVQYLTYNPLHTYHEVRLVLCQVVMKSIWHIQEIYVIKFFTGTWNSKVEVIGTLWPNWFSLNKVDELIEISSFCCPQQKIRESMNEMIFT